MIGLVLLAATTVAQPQQAAPREPLVRQATASIRILSGTRITTTEIPAEAQVRKTEVKDADGGKSVARLVEFQ